MGRFRLPLVLCTIVGVFMLSSWLAVARAEPPLVQLTTDPGTDVRPAWSPDGKRIAFQSNRTGRYQIWVMDVDGSNERLVGVGSGEDRHPAWSPDGQLLAFSSGTGGVREIWTMQADGRGRRQVTSLGAFSTFPSWSPDGREIAFYAYKDGVMDIWVVGADGNNLRRLTNGLADERRGQCTNSCHSAAWSPDGKQIAYAGGDHQSVWVVNADGTDAHQVTPGIEHEHFPFYLPDGRLAYITEHTLPTEAWTDALVVDPSGGEATPLLTGMRIQGPLEWSPDGTKVLFHSPRSGNFDIYLADLTVPGGAEALQSRIPAATAVALASQSGNGGPRQSAEQGEQLTTGQGSPVVGAILVGAVASLLVMGALIYGRRRGRDVR